jgi:hypothetical protein
MKLAGSDGAPAGAVAVLRRADASLVPFGNPIAAGQAADPAVFRNADSGAGGRPQPGADLGVGQAVAGQPGYLGLLGGQLIGGLDGALAGGLAGSRQLAAGPLAERLDAHRRQHVAGGAQLLARVGAAALAAQPLAVEQVSARELATDAGTAQPADRLAVETVGG